MKARPFLNLAPERQMVLTFALRQALEILQMPQLELGEWLTSEIEKNPLLEFGPPKLKRRFEGDFPAPISLQEHLSLQIREHFDDPQDQEFAFALMHQLDERGFLPLETATDRILEVLQTFNPPGVFARNLRESLLLQLRAKGQLGTLSYRLIEHCYEDLLHGRYAQMQKKLKTKNLKEAIQNLSRLTLRPVHQFLQDPAGGPICIDLLIQKIEGGWTIELLEEDLPPFHIQTDYLNIEPESKEEKESLRSFKTQAQWIFRSLNRRRKLLREIGHLLIRKQALFLDQKGPLTPLSMSELAAKLEIHESTLSRALSGKYAATPRGILPLRSLVTNDPEAQQAKELLEKLIRAEDKNYPFTDDQLAESLKGKGFKIARRTIAKYRNKLKIGSASQRKIS